MSIRGKVYTATEFDALQQRHSSLAMEHECNYMAEEIGCRIRILLQAAARRGRLDLVLSDLWTSLDQIRSSFGLSKLAKTPLENDSRGARREWHDICPPDKVVFFDDKGFYLYPRDTQVRRIIDEFLERGQKSMYGRSNDGALITITENVNIPAKDEGLTADHKRRRSSPNQLTTGSSK